MVYAVISLLLCIFRNCVSHLFGDVVSGVDTARDVSEVGACAERLYPHDWSERGITSVHECSLSDNNTKKKNRFIYFYNFFLCFLFSLFFSFYFFLSIFWIWHFTHSTRDKRCVAEHGTIHMMIALPANRVRVGVQFALVDTILFCIIRMIFFFVCRVSVCSTVCRLHCLCCLSLCVCILLIGSFWKLIEYRRLNNNRLKAVPDNFLGNSANLLRL